VLCIATVRQRGLLRRWIYTGTAILQYELSRISRTANTSSVRDNSYLAPEVLSHSVLICAGQTGNTGREAGTSDVSE